MLSPKSALKKISKIWIFLFWFVAFFSLIGASCCSSLAFSSADTIVASYVRRQFTANGYSAIDIHFDCGTDLLDKRDQMFSSFVKQTYVHSYAMGTEYKQGYASKSFDGKITSYELGQIDPIEDLYFFSAEKTSLNHTCYYSDMEILTKQNFYLFNDFTDDYVLLSQGLADELIEKLGYPSGSYDAILAKKFGVLATGSVNETPATLVVAGVVKGKVPEFLGRSNEKFVICHNNAIGIFDYYSNFEFGQSYESQELIYQCLQSLGSPRSFSSFFKQGDKLVDFDLLGYLSGAQQFTGNIGIKVALAVAAVLLSLLFLATSWCFAEKFTTNMRIALLPASFSIPFLTFVLLINGSSLLHISGLAMATFSEKGTIPMIVLLIAFVIIIAVRFVKIWSGGAKRYVPNVDTSEIHI